MKSLTSNTFGRQIRPPLSDPKQGPPPNAYDPSVHLTKIAAPEIGFGIEN